MSLFARARDANEKEIVKALRAVGAVVDQLNDFGVPDLLVGYKGVTYLLEVKLPDGARGGKKSGGASAKRVGGDGVLTEAQVKWWAKWPGVGGPARVVRTPGEALDAIGADAADVVQDMVDARQVREVLGRCEESTPDFERQVAAVCALIRRARDGRI